MTQQTRHPSGTRAIRASVPVFAFVAVLALTGPVAGAGTIYKWTDAEGNVQFSDTRPTHLPPEAYEGPKPQTVGESYDREHEETKRRLAEQRRLAVEQEEREAVAEAARKAAEPKDTIVSQYSCDQARGILASYQAGGSFFRVGEDGIARPSTVEEMQETIAEWELATETLCAEGAEIIVPETSDDTQPAEGEEGAEVTQ